MPLEEKLRRLAAWAGALVALLGLLTLLGGLFGIDFLHYARFEARPVKSNTALCLLLAGASLWLQLRGSRRAGQLCAALALALALAKIAETIFTADLGLDRWLETSTVGPRNAPNPAHFSEGAIALALLTLAVLFVTRDRPRSRLSASAWMANVAVAVGFSALFSLGLSTAAGARRPFQISSHVAFAMIVLGLGTLLARPEDRHVRILFARNAAGVLARRLFLGVAVLPLILAVALTALIRRSAIAGGDGVALFVAAMILCGFLIALFSIETAAGISESREEAEQARLLLTARLQEQAAQLQETVSRRTQELREANASLRAAAESNALLALVAQNTASGVVITDAAGRIEWVNTAWERMTGYTLGEVRGRKPGRILQGPDTDRAVIARLREAEQYGLPSREEILNYTREGTPFWVAMDIQPVRDRTGQLINFVANQADITARRASEAQVQHLTDRLKLATRAAALGVWEWDALTERGLWDERTLEIYGLTPEQFKGTREEWLTRIHPDDRPRALDAIQAALACHDSYELEFRILRASDGAERHLQSRAVVQRDSRGRVLRVTGTECDVTAEREATLRMEVLTERLQLALRSSNFGVWEIDIASGRRNWDLRMFEIYGMPPENFSAAVRGWESVLHPGDRAAALQRMQDAIDGRTPGYDDEFRVVRPDGATRHIEAHGYLQRDSAGRPVRLVGLVRDITEHKQMVQALDFAEQRWQLAIEGTNDSVWDWDVETGVVYHDERWARMLGYEPDELDRTLEGWKALVHPEDLPANESAVEAHFAQRTPFYQHELRMRAKDGTWRWILDRGKVVRRAADGRPLRMAGTHSDVTARRELEERLKKTEEVASEVSRLAQIGGWEIDLENGRVTWTDGARRIHEVDDAFQPTPESVWSFLADDALAIVQGALNALAPDSPSFDVEVPLLTARGRRAWVRILGHGEFRHGKSIGVRGAIQDVTGRHESEEARRELEARLFQAQKMETLGTLAGGIAHDFNNLLTGIIGYHELAADSVPEDHPARMCLNEARNASLRARELVEQILTFGRQTGGGEHTPIDLTLVLEEARRFLRATLPANIAIEVRCAPQCPLVQADATQLHQVILNLGSNAAHAMRHQGGVLTISLEPAEVTPDLALTLGGPPASSYVRLSVGDTGHGMDEPTRRRIFDPFFTTKNTREGTGLGLAVVHGIVRSHRGAIDVESTPGRGSTFHLYLPTAAQKNAETDGAPASAPRGLGEYICVVDDEEVVGSCTKLVLESRGYRTLVFASAEQCLAELDSSPNPCAVLLTDQTMPGMQGTELAAALRKKNAALPVVIMSGYFSKISPQALDELGQIELLAKPFTTDELAQAIHRALHPAERVSM